MTTAFTRGDLDAVRRACADGKPLARRVDTPDGYERLEVALVAHTDHKDKSEHYWPAGVKVLLQYWRQKRNIMTFRNYTSYAEWEEDLKRS